MAALYLYGVTRPGVALPTSMSRGVAGSTVRLLEHDSLASVVSDVPDEAFRAQRADLMAHSNVLQDIFESSAVLPMRFGTAFSSADELVSEFLEPNEEPLIHMLDRLDGTVEVQLKGEYEPEVVAREIVSGDRSIQRLQARVRSRGDVDSRIELGRRFATALDEKRYADGRGVVDALGPLAEQSAIGEASGEYGVLNVAFLVRREQLQRFDAAVESVRAALDGRATVRYVGPLPPYSFVDAESMVVG